MNTAETIHYARTIGEQGGTLTLEYNEGEITLTGQDLVDAANDYDMGNAFTIVTEVTGYWELDNEEPHPVIDIGNLGGIVTACALGSAFFLIGLVLML